MRMYYGRNFGTGLGLYLILYFGKMDRNREVTIHVTLKIVFCQSSLENEKNSSSEYIIQYQFTSLWKSVCFK